MAGGRCSVHRRDRSAILSLSPSPPNPSLRPPCSLPAPPRTLLPRPRATSRVRFRRGAPPGRSYGRARRSRGCELKDRRGIPERRLCSSFPHGVKRVQAVVTAVRTMLVKPVPFFMLGLGLEIVFDLIFPLSYFFIDLRSNLTFFVLSLFLSIRNRIVFSVLIPI